MGFGSFLCVFDVFNGFGDRFLGIIIRNCRRFLEIVSGNGGRLLGIILKNGGGSPGTIPRYGGGLSGIVCLRMLVRCSESFIRDVIGTWESFLGMVYVLRNYS